MLSCCQSDNNINGTLRHSVTDLSSYLRRLYKRDVTYCDVHPDEPIGLYCFDCRTVLCTICNIDGGHRVHRQARKSTSYLNKFCYSSQMIKATCMYNSRFFLCLWNNRIIGDYDVMRSNENIHLIPLKCLLGLI
jgi:B-box zinc finger